MNPKMWRQLKDNLSNKKSITSEMFPYAKILEEMNRLERETALDRLEALLNNAKSYSDQALQEMGTQVDIYEGTQFFSWPAVLINSHKAILKALRTGDLSEIETWVIKEDKN